MDYGDKMMDGLRREKACRALARRFKKISKKSKGARSMGVICAAHDLGGKSYISKISTGKFVASWEKITQIEEALNQEYAALGIKK